VPTVAVGRAEFDHRESFCARPPAGGHIRYVAAGHHVTLTLAVSGLPHHTDLGVGWHNTHSARGYTIASFRTDDRGRGKQRTLRMFRAGEVKGSMLYLATGSGAVVAKLKPCA
jgi:hypothetical protein